MTEPYPSDALRQEIEQALSNGTDSGLLTPLQAVFHLADTLARLEQERDYWQEEAKRNLADSSYLISCVLSLLSTSEYK